MDNNSPRADLHQIPKPLFLSVLCFVSVVGKNYRGIFACYMKWSDFFKRICKHLKANCLRNSKIDLKFLVGQAGLWVIEQNNTLHVLINKSITVCPIEILIPILSFLENLLHGVLSYFSKKVLSKLQSKMKICDLNLIFKIVFELCLFNQMCGCLQKTTTYWEQTSVI